MGWCMDWSLFIGLNEQQFKIHLKEACFKTNLSLKLKPLSKTQGSIYDLRWKESRGGVSLMNPGGFENSHLISRLIGEFAGCHWIWAQASHDEVWWYYYLRHGTETIDAFNVSKGQCRANGLKIFLTRRSRAWHAAKLARLCRVPAKKIIHYFQDWGASSVYRRGTAAYRK